jgi:hypothetical protein
MYQPEDYLAALALIITSMICWGSWANTVKLTAGYAFQVFYWDYVIGVMLGSVGWGLTLGNWRGGDLSFLNNISQADPRHLAFAIPGGAVFHAANLLLVAAIDIAGPAVAFPVGIGPGVINDFIYGIAKYLVNVSAKFGQPGTAMYDRLAVGVAIDSTLVEAPECMWTLKFTVSLRVVKRLRTGRATWSEVFCTETITWSNASIKRSSMQKLR